MSSALSLYGHLSGLHSSIFSKSISTLNSVLPCGLVPLHPRLPLWPPSGTASRQLRRDLGPQPQVITLSLHFFPSSHPGPFVLLRPTEQAVLRLRKLLHSGFHRVILLKEVFPKQILSTPHPSLSHCSIFLLDAVIKSCRCMFSSSLHCLLHRHVKNVKSVLF